MANKQIVALWILALLLLNGCCGGGETKVCKDSLTPIKQTGIIFPETSSVGIYVDTTPSMKGFLCTQRSTSTPHYYTICLDAIRNMVAAKYKKENVSFYRVDTSVWKVSENALTEAKYSSYYVASESFEKSRGYINISGGNDYSYPCLTSALQNGEAEDLFILITDLYENDSDNADGLINEFQRLAGIDDNKVFGFFGVRTQFAGEVFDIGPDSLTVEYGVDQDEFRPFYVLVRGYPNEVKDLFDNLEKRLNIPAKNYFKAIFSPSFQGLDYQNFNSCIIDDKVIWEKGNAKVEINGEKELPVYDFLGKRDVLSDEMLFSYLVPEFLRAEFATIAEASGDKESVLIGSAEKQVYRLAIPVRETQISRWSDGEQEFEDLTEARGSFTVSSLFYEPDEGLLYVGLKISGFTQGIWRLQWRNAVKQVEEPPIWLESWGSYSGSDDCSKTERLGDYVNAIMFHAMQEEQCILNGNIYLNVRG